MSDPGTLDGVWIMVPARGGSRGIRGKNLRTLAGRPLICTSWTSCPEWCRASG